MFDKSMYSKWVCFLEFNFSKVSNMFDIFRKLNSRKSILQIVKFLILHNSILEFKKSNSINLNVPRGFNELLYLKIMIIHSPYHYLLLYSLFKMLSGRIKCHLFWAWPHPQNYWESSSIKTSLSSLKNSILEQKVCMAKIMELIMDMKM